MSDVNVDAARERVVACARSWIGVPWRHQGRNRSGVDCGGLIFCVGMDLGLLIPGEDAFGYERAPTLMMIADTARDVCGMRQKKGQEFNDRQPGDVVIMKPTQAYKWPSHLGILSRLPDGELGMVHSYSRIGQRYGLENGGVMEVRYSGWWNNTVAVFEYPRLREGG